jgi:SAM-dependent methyltransferase
MHRNSKEWFSDWFNSPFYHILYKHRDFEEAQAFINELQKFLHFKEGQRALDAACGKGRHALYLHQKGLVVDGIDLSSHSIECAQKLEEEGLKFYVHDIRNVFHRNTYDYIFNLFTSFGYFNREEDNFNTIDAFAKELKKDGRLVIDFLNPVKIIKELVHEESQTIDAITFKIRRRVEDNFIIKDISFTHKGQPYAYSEKVSALRYDDFLNYFKFAGLALENTFGNYELMSFDPITSERMIFIARKK